MKIFNLFGEISGSIIIVAGPSGVVVQIGPTGPQGIQGERGATDIAG